MKSRRIIALLAFFGLHLPCCCANPMTIQMSEDQSAEVLPKPQLPVKGAQKTLSGRVEAKMKLAHPAGCIDANAFAIPVQPLAGNAEKTKIAAPLSRQVDSIHIETGTDTNPTGMDDFLRRPLLGGTSTAGDNLQLKRGVEKTNISDNPGASKDESEDPYDSRQLKGERITLRLTCYQTLIGFEVAWECLRDANKMLDHGADVTIMLDREGVRLANKHNLQQFQVNRGSTERLIPEQQMFRQFIDRGGHVIASERWAKTFGVAGGSYQALPDGVKLLTDEEMSVQLVKRRGQIVDY